MNERSKTVQEKENSPAWRFTLILGIVGAIWIGSIESVWGTTSESAGYRSMTLPVVKENASIYAGPGSEFYDTGFLTQNQPVEIFMRKPDGWCAIRPPEGCFSWINAKFVQVDEDQIGEIISEGAKEIPVRVGAESVLQSSVIQIGLKKGDFVRILGQSSLPGGSQWYKIAPPAGEFRWIHEKDLAADESLTTFPAELTLNYSSPESSLGQSDTMLSDSQNSEKRADFSPDASLVQDSVYQRPQLPAQADSAFDVTESPHKFSAWDTQSIEKGFRLEVAQLNRDLFLAVVQPVSPETFDLLSERADVLYEAAIDEEQRNDVKRIQKMIEKHQMIAWQRAQNEGTIRLASGVGFENGVASPESGFDGNNSGSLPLFGDVELNEAFSRQEMPNSSGMPRFPMDSEISMNSGENWGSFSQENAANLGTSQNSSFGQNVGLYEQNSQFYNSRGGSITGQNDQFQAQMMQQGGAWDQNSLPEGTNPNFGQYFDANGTNGDVRTYILDEQGRPVATVPNGMNWENLQGAGEANGLPNTMSGRMSNNPMSMNPNAFSTSNQPRTAQAPGQKTSRFGRMQFAFGTGKNPFKKGFQTTGRSKKSLADGGTADMANGASLSSSDQMSPRKGPRKVPSLFPSASGTRLVPPHDYQSRTDQVYETPIYGIQEGENGSQPSLMLNGIPGGASASPFNQPSSSNPLILTNPQIPSDRQSPLTLSRSNNLWEQLNAKGGVPTGQNKIASRGLVPVQTVQNRLNAQEKDAKPSSEHVTQHKNAKTILAQQTGDSGQWRPVRSASDQKVPVLISDSNARIRPVEAVLEVSRASENPGDASDPNVGNPIVTTPPQGDSAQNSLPKIEKLPEFSADDALLTQNSTAPSKRNATASTAQRPPSFDAQGRLGYFPDQAANLPRYALIQEVEGQKKIVCYLNAETGKDLDAFIGQNVGVNGTLTLHKKGKEQRTVLNVASVFSLDK